MATKTMELAKSKVVFDEVGHKYFLDGKELNGITSILSRRLFKDKYAGVDPEVLKKAAERGTNIHYEIQVYICAGIDPQTPEAKHYSEWFHDVVKPIESEYLVSDEKSYASSIDIVGEGSKKNRVRLYDIKTYKSGIKEEDKEYVRWQLSIYAHFFEKMNPKVKVESLSGIWLSEDKGDIFDVERIDDNIIEELLTADTLDLDFENPFKKELVPETEAIADFLSFEQVYQKLSAALKELEAKKKDALTAVEQIMDDLRTNHIETEHLTFTRVEPTSRQTFDTRKFKADHPDMVDQYMKTSPVAGFIKATIKK